MCAGSYEISRVLRTPAGMREKRERCQLKGDVMDPWAKKIYTLTNLITGFGRKKKKKCEYSRLCKFMQVFTR